MVALCRRVTAAHGQPAAIAHSPGPTALPRHDGSIDATNANPMDLAKTSPNKGGRTEPKPTPMGDAPRLSASARPATAPSLRRLIIVLGPAPAPPGIPPSVKRRGACGQHHRLLASRPRLHLHRSTAGRLTAHAGRQAGILIFTCIRPCMHCTRTPVNFPFFLHTSERKL